MEKVIQLVFETYGIVGVIMLSPFAAVVALWAENRSLHKEHAEKLASVNDKLVKAQEQRVMDAQSITGKMMEMVSEQSAMNKETNLALDRVGDLMSATLYAQKGAGK